MGVHLGYDFFLQLNRTCFNDRDKDRESNWLLCEKQDMPCVCSCHKTQIKSKTT